MLCGTGSAAGEAGAVSVKPRLLDVFCGAGGATRGYQMAGFHVTGVDLSPQPRYVGDEFIQADALEFLATVKFGDYAVIHASPPCQPYCDLRDMWNAKEHSDLVGPIRARLLEIGTPYVIENVEGAPLLNALRLCGTSFRLRTSLGAELRRHRLFEISPYLLLSPMCSHARGGAVIGVYGGHGRDRRRKANTQDFPTWARREAMGIDWMTGTELSQAIPPAYTHWIGTQLRAHLEGR